MEMNILDFYLQYQRVIWIIGGLLLIIISLLINVVRRHRLEQSLRESENRWKLLFRALPGSSFIVNEQRIVEDVNDALCEMVGLSREELLGRPCKLLCANAPDQCLMSGSGPSRVCEHEGTVTTKAGQRIPVLQSIQRVTLGDRSVILESFQDISQRKEAESILQRSKESERHFREWLTALHEVNTALDQAESRDELCRLAVELARDRLDFERIGIWFVSERPDEIVGSYGIDRDGNLQDERSYRHVIQGNNFIKRLLEQNRPGTFCETGILRNAAGDEVGNGPRMVSTLWDGRRIIGFLSADNLQSGREISEQQQKILNLFALSLGHVCTMLAMGQEQTKLEAQLRQAAKMEAVGRLAGGIAHDFNNQLTVITGYCDLLMRDLPPGSYIRESVDQIEKSARQASALTGELLNFSRKEIIHPDVIDTNRALWNMEKSLAMLGEDIRLDIHTSDDLGNIRVDANRFQQAVMNLAINARDAMPEGGRLAIEAVNYTVQPALAALLVSIDPGPYVRISISDTGVGMDRETQQKIFEPFFTTKDRGKGTGLGLCLVYGFIQQSGGQIDIESQPGKGTTFHIYLPRLNEPVCNASSEDAKSLAESGNETVLVVEDDAAVRRLVVRVLQEYGYAVLETGHPEDALRMVQQLGRPIDLLISDVVMPGLYGPKLARMLNAVQPGLKVLYISGYTEETVIKHGVDDSLVAFLHKPFSPEELCRAITRVLSGAEEQPAHV